jgi:hypothetical protein
MERFKAYKQTLGALGIEHTFLTGEKNCFCQPLEIGLREWLLSADANLQNGENCLHIKYAGNYLDLPVILRKNDAFSYTAGFVGKPAAAQPLFAAVAEMLEKEDFWNKRREERHPLGIDLSQAFGLASPEQRLFCNGLEFPCLLNNVSFGGANCTAPAATDFSRGCEVVFRLAFSQPLERISVKGCIQSVSVKTGTVKDKSHTPPRFAILSAQFSDPPLAFKQRLGRWIENRENKSI